MSFYHLSLLFEGWPPRGRPSGGSIAKKATRPHPKGELVSNPEGLGGAELFCNGGKP